MAASICANAVGGPSSSGFISAVAFATILAVVAGLTLVGRLGGQPRSLCRGHRPRPRLTSTKRSASRRSPPSLIGIVAIILGYIFENQNVAFMVGLAFAVAASCNFPVLLMSILWKRHHDRGALIGGLRRPGQRGRDGGPVSKAVWVQTFGFKAALFPYDNPALFSMPIAFLGIWAVLEDRRQRRARPRAKAAFEAQYVRSETGIGAAAAMSTRSRGNGDRRRDLRRPSRPSAERCRNGSTPPTRPSTA